MDKEEVDSPASAWRRRTSRKNWTSQNRVGEELRDEDAGASLARAKCGKPAALANLTNSAKNAAVVRLVLAEDGGATKRPVTVASRLLLCQVEEGLKHTRPGCNRCEQEAGENFSASPSDSAA